MMKKTFFAALIVATSMASCSEEDLTKPKERQAATDCVTQTMTEAQAQRAFAKVLSKAVYNSKDIRDFIKNEAQKQFDNNYDVLYGLVKDQQLPSGETFGEAIAKYGETSKTELEAISKKFPLLSILVPDASVIEEGFTNEKWDTSDPEVGVSYEMDGGSGVVFSEGDSVMTIEHDEIPGFPVLVVRGDKRVGYNADAKPVKGESQLAGGYYLLDPIFDGTKRKPSIATRTDFDRELPVKDNSNFVPEDTLNKYNQDIIKAYNEFKGNRNAVHRDYIYYGMSNTKTEGTLNKDVREAIYKFKVNPSVYEKISNSDDDPKTHSASTEKAQYSDEKLVRKLWKSGNYIFDFATVIANEQGNSFKTQRYECIATGPETFDIKTVHVHKRHKTGMRHTKYTYKVDSKCIIGKWIYTQAAAHSSTPLYIGLWDISSDAVNFCVTASEFDTKKNFEKTVEYTSVTGGSASFKFGAGPIKIGFGVSKKNTSHVKTHVAWTEDSNDMGNCFANYEDPIITDSRHLKEIDGKSFWGYDVFTVANGAIEYMFLPVRIWK